MRGNNTVAGPNGKGTEYNSSEYVSKLRSQQSRATASILAGLEDWGAECAIHLEHIIPEGKNKVGLQPSLTSDSQDYLTGSSWARQGHGHFQSSQSSLIQRLDRSLSPQRPKAKGISLDCNRHHSSHYKVGTLITRHSIVNEGKEMFFPWRALRSLISFCQWLWGWAKIRWCLSLLQTLRFHCSFVLWRSSSSAQGLRDFSLCIIIAGTMAGLG